MWTYRWFILDTSSLILLCCFFVQLRDVHKLNAVIHLRVRLVGLGSVGSSFFAIQWIGTGLDWVKENGTLDFFVRTEKQVMDWKNMQEEKLGKWKREQRERKKR